MGNKIKNVRKMTWALWAWCLAIIAWAIGAGSTGAHDAANCTKTAYLSAADCANATGAGAGIAVLLILLIGFFGFVFLSIIWFMSRPKPQPV